MIDLQRTASSDIWRAAAAVLALIGLAAALGAVMAVAPFLAVMAIGMAGLGILVVMQWARPVFFGVLIGLLLGYALMGRGFAYLGLEPIFLGEFGLVLAVVAMLPQILAARLNFYQILVIVFVLWGIARTVPFVSVYGFDALRDGVVWGYAAFALALSMLLRREHFPRIISLYAVFAPLIILWVPFAYLLQDSYGTVIPTVPGADIGLLSLRKGEAAVHLAGIAAFLLIGLYSRTLASQGSRAATSIPLAWLWPLWILGAALSSPNRGSMLTIGLVVMAVLFLWRSQRSAVFIGVVLIAVVGAGTLNLGIESDRRDVSIAQMGRNLLSVVSPDAAPELQSTSNWRRNWWDDIYSYTVTGPYFWTGKGFGVNLADDDGYQVFADSSLRSPHNAHMTILARMGVPGFLLWCALLVALGTGLIRAFHRARKRGDTFWAGTYLWIFAYGLAMVVNMMVTVYLEGPQGGIWFWSLVGVAIAALAVQHEPHPPDAVEAGASPGSESGEAEAAAAAPGGSEGSSRQEGATTW